MNRRDFLKTGAAATGVAAMTGLGARPAAAQESPGTITIGHLIGICMSPLFYADVQGYFKEEGLNVQLKWMQNAGDNITAVASGAIPIGHVPFTNAYVAASKGAPVKVIGGSGAGGLVVIAQKASGVKSIADLKKKVGTEFTVGSQRVNTLELTLYRMLVNNGMSYDDFKMVWFTDLFAMAAAFEQGRVDVVTHVEPYSTMLVDKHGGVPLATNLDVWGKGAPDCVVTAHADFVKKYPQTTRKYLRALLKADHAIKADLPKAVEVLDRAKYYKVDGPTLRAALPRQLPQVDLLESSRGMEAAIADMVTLKYLSKMPENVTDFAALKDVVRG
jgi:NitT/TauT family transport system substrate-binding protein